MFEVWIRVRHEDLPQAQILNWSIGISKEENAPEEHPGRFFVSDL